MTKITTQLVPSEWKSKRPGKKMQPLYITIHSTGNPKSTAKNEADYVTKQNPNTSVSYHYVVDAISIYNVIPDNEIAWHAGDGGSGTGNNKSIGVEICESGNRQATLLNAIDLTLTLMKKYNIPISNIVQHNKWSGKNCPRILRDKNYILDNLDWAWFVSKLKEGLTKMGVEQATETVQEKTGIGDEAIQHILNYKYGEELMKKLAMAMIK